ncbi:DUF3828 domain-containing protein [Pseudomonas sp. DTU_2021_1001937_2_SI_NGA_ILE_001]|uniref:DUF3828 domain-containing protein n=1 Tax=Pseudomonas sp. DTU_2021_1001937_2_SI_NGA_ILE_001 TaxID=3077589 RepID=UPI0028FC0F71|nr:DUF3828 domain-containing protein [Pseudomonas sp. DTU_2021_1001937_2_SI_NGA_ILE_001]WNW10552.1 DUF3828 domain-containing protein [Pseudomonas sp. DTU_2021_1001937_2_SI_NGA_ILE_001]
MYKALAFAAAFSLSAPALAACPANTPADTARWIFTQHADFYVKGKGGPQYLSANLLDWLKKDWACQANGDMCAISADPWTDAQDGEVQQPVTWKQVSNADGQAVVEMSYLLGYKNAPAQQGVEQTTRLLLVKSPASQCWVLDNLQGPGDRPLLDALQEFPYDGD